MGQIKRDDVSFQWTAETDFLWCMFVTAAQSYKHDSVLVPFPMDFIDPTTKEKNIDALRRCIDSWKDTDIRNKDPLGLQNLIHWTCTLPKFRIVQETDPSALITKLLHDTGDASASNSLVSATLPRAIFTLEYSSEENALFESRGTQFRRLWAWHGTQLSNLYSIMHNGLQNVRNRNSVFGEGTYLSSELSVALSFAPTGSAWRHSRLGSRLSCVLLCELIDSPEGGLLRQTSDPRRRAVQNAAAASDSLGGGSDGVPERYYLVRNDELVRVRHVVLYGADSADLNQAADNATMLPRIGADHGWLRHVRSHLTLVLVLGYVFLLLIASMSQSHVARDVGRTIRNFIWDPDSDSDFSI